MSFLISIKAYLATMDLAHGIGVAIGGLWRGLKQLPRRMGAACVAFLKTPAVWAAAPTFMLVGYLVGFALLEPKLLYLRDQARTMTKTQVTLQASLGDLKRQNSDLEEALRKLREAPSESAAPIAHPAAKPAPVAPRQAPAKRRPPPASTGNSGWWW